ncbi:MAG TPA: hypothetical protein VHZ99_03375 [Steroidobacteraceae bacterium]|nr:hypothetical protein [Steroidobacteraceae bacterium]
MQEHEVLHGIRSFKKMHELHLPTRAGDEAVAHFALAFKGEVQFEIIEPLSGDIGIYQNVLPVEGYATRFHHLGRFAGSREAYDACLRNARTHWTMPIDYGAFGGFYAYADARQDLGHYLEFFTFPDDDFFADVPRY